MADIDLRRDRQTDGQDVTMQPFLFGISLFRKT